MLGSNSGENHVTVHDLLGGLLRSAVPGCHPASLREYILQPACVQPSILLEGVMRERRMVLAFQVRPTGKEEELVERDDPEGHQSQRRIFRLQNP